MDELYLKVCYITKRVLFVLERYPVFNHHYIKRNIDKPTTSGEELKEYHLNSDRAGVARSIIIISIYLAYTIKDYIIPYVTFSLFDHLNLEDNLKPVLVTNQANSIRPDNTGARDFVQETNWFRFACVMTNCSKLSDHQQHDSMALTSSLTNLATDLSKLPMFMICHPMLDSFYTPVTKLDAFGLLAFCISGFGVWLFGCLLPIQQLLYPASNELIMFITAPKVTTEVMLSKARRILFDLSISYHNMRLNLFPLQVGTQIILSKRLMEEKQLQFAKYQQKSRGDTIQQHYMNKSVELLHANAGATNDILMFKTKGPQDDNELNGLIKRFEKYHNEQQQAATCKSFESNHCGFYKGPWHSIQQFDGQAQDQLIEKIVKRSCLRGKSDKQIEQILGDCLPAIRTNWWRLLSASVLTYALIVSLGSISFIGCSCFWAININAGKKQVLLREFSQQMVGQHCSIFALNDQDLINTTVESRSDVDNLLKFEWNELNNNHKEINLNELDLSWTYYAAWETSVLNFIPGFSIAFMFAYYYCIMCEIYCLLAESRAYLVACVAFTKTQTMLKLLDPSSAHHSSERAYQKINKYFQLERLRGKFIMETFFWLKLFPLGKIKLANNEQHFALINAKAIDKLRLKQYMTEFFSSHRIEATNSNNVVSELDEDNGDTKQDGEHEMDTSMETLEKVYVNFRLFLEHIHQCTRSSGVLLSVTYLLNFGCLQIAVVLSRKIRNFFNEPIYVVIFGFFVANSLVFLGSNFHASAKKLHPLIWSLIAQMAHSSDLRMRHLRELWLRQISMLDREGGVALRAFGIRVTYVNIIQLMIWMCTVLVIALKP